MKAKRIINTFALVCVIIAIIVGAIESGDTDEFISGLALGVCFSFWLLKWCLES